MTPPKTRKEKTNIHKPTFIALRSYLIEALAADDKIGVAPTVPSSVKQPLKIKCLKCGFLFPGDKHRRICHTCVVTNRGIV